MPRERTRAGHASGCGLGGARLAGEEDACSLWAVAVMSADAAGGAGNQRRNGHAPLWALLAGGRAVRCMSCPICASVLAGGPDLLQKNRRAATGANAMEKKHSWLAADRVKCPRGGQASRRCACSDGRLRLLSPVFPFLLACPFRFLTCWRKFGNTVQACETGAYFGSSTSRRHSGRPF
jgi:hypothetical protein